jgi:hypothetical protein
MRSPLEILAGRFDHALLTTYSFNLRFFEEWVLRALWAAEVRNVVVFVDQYELAQALADRAPSAAGRAYHAVAATVTKAAFHPKVLLVTGRNGVRVCVSSANLTPDGQLRNAESIIAFDSQLDGHLRPILDAGDLFRRLSENAPAHTTEAIQAALADMPEDEDAKSGYRFVHNLDEPLIDIFPRSGATRAIAPYVDADGAAAARLHERGSLTVIVDAQNIVAAEGFFAGPWTVDAREFSTRLHGKAYEVVTPDGRWALVGSPNLSSPALLQSAGSGNLEVAVAVTVERPLELPTSSPHENPERLPQQAAARLFASHLLANERQAAGRAFDAWEDERRIVVSGVPDGAKIERWKTERWHPLGTVSDGAVWVQDPEVRPTRIRAILPDGAQAFAVVASPSRLRARMRAPTSGRQTQAVERLPLDVETVQVLEEALSQLYVLAELAGDVPKPPRPPRRSVTEPAEDTHHGLIGWMPRFPDEEPRVPSLYTNHWKGEPDALLALISRVLRLDSEEATQGERQVAREQVDIEDLETVVSDEQVEVEDPIEDTPDRSVDPYELERYRRAFHHLFARGLAFVSSTADATLAGWAFTYLLRLIEDLKTHHVEISGRKEPLMLAEPLRKISLDLLETYLSRSERDPLCLATARVHLAAAVRQRSRYSVRDTERLDALCFTWASELVDLPSELPAPDPSALDLNVAGAVAWLQDYADRSNWKAIEEEAAARLHRGWLEDRPWPVIVGRASIPDRLTSPAWALIAFAAPAGFEANTPFGAVLHNSIDGPIVTHAVVCDPRHHLVVEAWERSNDHVWLERRYPAATRATVERLQNYMALGPADKVVEHEKPEDLGEPLRSLAPLLVAARTGLE